MTDQELDSLMHRVLLDSIKFESGQAADDIPVFVPTISHQRQMKRMLDDPFGWLRRRERPLWKSVARQIAVVILVLALGFGCVIAASPTARATVIRWFTQWYETHVTYWYEGGNITEKMPQFEISALPDGYMEVEHERIAESNYISTLYQSEAGAIIYFGYTYIQQGSAMDVITENIDVLPVMVNGCEGWLYLTKVPGEADNMITWIDANSNVQFTINASLDRTGLLSLAESVSHVKTEN